MLIARYLFRRFLYSIPIFLGVTLLIFFLFHVVIGDPTLILLGKHASAPRVAELRQTLGLDKALVWQYVDTLKSALTFSFGRSWATHQHIASMMQRGAFASLTFSIPAFVLSSGLAIAIALVAAFYRGRLLDRALVVVCVVMMSISILAYILFGQWLFAYKLGWFEISGYEEGFPAFIPYIILPALIWVVLSIGPDVRFYRTILLDEVYQDYVRTARAKGLSERAILFKHVLKNALIPIITNLSIQLPSLILGALLIESFFGIPGLGSMTLQAINQADFPVVKAMAILSSLLYIVFNILTDVLYVVVDPRLRLQ